MTNASCERLMIRIDSEVTRRVRQHARAHMQNEVCGVLIGRFCEGAVEIKAPIEAFNAAGAGAHVTFTQAAWETIYRVKDKDYPEDRIVGWYHSHPGFGVFLSDHDTFIHRNFFSSPDQVAWVYDPHSDEEGCFGWIDGSIRRMASIHIADSSAEEAPRAPDKIPEIIESQAAITWQIETETERHAPPPPTKSGLTVPVGKVWAAGFRWSRSLMASLARSNGRVPAQSLASQKTESKGQDGAPSDPDKDSIGQTETVSAETNK